ncbi:MAG TPA: TetR/AcrR family transcriptional regulator, partial [Phenylobacterium sp.]|nr:TetR/AcrR family transcriptional regulator [Phenylobacterium sp.]
TSRPRLSAPARRLHLVEAAARLIEVQGFLPPAMELVARGAGVSKALVYQHFPDALDLCDAVLEAELDDLEAGGLEASTPPQALEAAALAAADIYFEHVARRGPVLHVIYRDPVMRDRLSARARRLRDRVLGGLARRLRRGAGLDARLAVGAVSLMLTIPEEAGRLVRQDRLSKARGRLLCRELLSGALEAVVEQPRA